MLFRVSCLLWGLSLLTTIVKAQPEVLAYDKLVELTKTIHGNSHYSCKQLMDIKYAPWQQKVLRDTSIYIRRGKYVYQKSKIAEVFTVSEGEILINHQLQLVSFTISDSLRKEYMKEIGYQPDTAMMTMLDSNFLEKDVIRFRDFLTQQCLVSWKKLNAQEEQIHFTAKKPQEAIVLSFTVRFTGDLVTYYEYVCKDEYTVNKLTGKPMYRTIKTAFFDFNYRNVPDFPVKFSDYLSLDDGMARLKKYKNYKLTVL